MIFFKSGHGFLTQKTALKAFRFFFFLQTGQQLNFRKKGDGRPIFFPLRTITLKKSLNEKNTSRRTQL